MVDISSFVIRNSGRYSNCFYIDYLGHYFIPDIAEQIGLDAFLLEGFYKDCGGSLKEDGNVYYFEDYAAAQNVLSKLLLNIKTSKKGRSVFLTENEIEYIRKALITESSSSIGKNHKLQDSIFKKLNT